MAPIEDQDYYLNVLKPIFYIALAIASLFYFLGEGIFTLEEGEDMELTLSLRTVVGFILLLTISTFLFYIVFMKLKNIGIRLIYGTILLLMQIVFLLEVISISSEISGNWIFQYVLFTISIIGFITVLYLFYGYIKPIYFVNIRNFNIFLASVTAGRVISLSLEFWTLIFFSLLLSIFDIWSVFRGPLSKIIGKPKFNNRDPKVRQVDDVQFLAENTKRVIQKGTPVYVANSHKVIIGIGDFLIYSILMYSAMIEFALIGLIISFLMISCGIILTFYLLKRLSPLPGLPIPVFLTIIGLLLLKFLW